MTFNVARRKRIAIFRISKILQGAAVMSDNKQIHSNVCSTDFCVLSTGWSGLLEKLTIFQLLKETAASK
jgi:hypothetical protein